MSRKPVVLSLNQLQEAAQAAVAIAVADRTTALSNEEARSISGGAIQPSVEPIEPILLGALPLPLDPFGLEPVLFAE